MPQIAVLIPCYNEECTIGKVVNDFRKSLPEATVYVYDNNSSDATAVKAREAGAIVRYERCQGKGNVVRSMFRDIDADCYIMVDGDDTYPADMAGRMVSMVMSEGIDMVIGDRLSTTYFEQNKRPFHNAGNQFVVKTINRLFHSDVKDVMSGYRVMSRRFVKHCPILSSGFEVETEMTIHALDKNMSIKEVPIEYRDRTEGSVSKLNTFSDGIKIIMTIASLYRDYRPLSFFSSIAAVLALISTLFLIPVLSEYLQTGLVPRFPTLIVCTMVLLIALMTFFCGVIIHVIVRKNKFMYELHLISK